MPRFRTIACALALLLAVGPARAQIPFFGPQEDPETPAPRRTPAEETPPGDEFVWAKDFSDNLRKIDPKATVDWDGRVLRVKASGQSFSMFPRNTEIVVNGAVEQIDAPLRIYRNEIYVPQSAIEAIGRQLDKSASATPTPGPETTTVTIAAAGTTSPSATATPTPTPTPTPTLVAVATATPAAATPTARPVADLVLTPAPATPSPTPGEVVVEPSRPGAKTPAPTTAPSGRAAAVPLEVAMRDLVDLAGRRVPRLSQSELTARASQKSIKTVVLDPDEGYGSEAGTAAKRCSDLSLELAEKVKARLELKGIAVVLTRRADRRVSPGERLEVVANSNAGALVSIRVAYSDFPDASGPRAYFPSISVDASASKGLVREGGDSVPPEMNFQAFEDNSRVLAGALLEAAKAGTGSAASTDIVPSALYLHRRAPMPSALVVVGYASNRLDSLMLNDEARRDKLADALAGAISAFAGLEANARIPEVAQSQ